MLVFRLAGQCQSKNESSNKKINSYLEKILNPEELHVYKTNNDEIVATPGESNIRVSIASEKNTMLKHDDQVCPNPRQATKTCRGILKS